jgi:hypothetical protein
MLRQFSRSGVLLGLAWAVGSFAQARQSVAQQVPAAPVNPPSAGTQQDQPAAPGTSRSSDNQTERSPATDPATPPAARPRIGGQENNPAGTQPAQTGQGRTEVEGRVRTQIETDPQGADVRGNAGARIEGRNDAGRQGRTEVEGGARTQIETDPQGADVRGDAGARIEGRNDAGRTDASGRIRGEIDAQIDDNRDPNVEADTRGDLGWTVDFSDQRGMTITSIENQGLASRAGIRRGDRLMSIDGRRFRTLDEMRTFLGSYNGARLPVEVLRNGRRETIFLDYGSQLGLQTSAPAALGVSLSGANRNGLVVSRVYQASPAFEAGLRPGDVIFALNGRRYVDTDSFVDAIRVLPTGQPVTLRVLRDGQYQDLRATLVPQNEAFAYNEPAGQTSERYTTLRPVQGGDLGEVLRELQTMRQEMASLRREVSELRLDLHSSSGREGLINAPRRPDADGELRIDGRTDETQSFDRDRPRLDQPTRPLDESDSTATPGTSRNEQSPREQPGREADRTQPEDDIPPPPR